jgi:hypothetical protein
MGPDPESTQLHIMLGLAGDRAGMTTDAASLINDHANPLPRFREMRTKIFPGKRSRGVNIHRKK